ncbi:MAG: sugar ABC transporter permease [Treponema sp.]|nr:sugar ABC transporter permease [Treponema sp.]
MKKKSLVPKYWIPVFLGPFVLFYAVFHLFPILNSFYVSFTDWDGLIPTSKNFIGLRNYGKVFQDPLFYRALFNTLRIMVFQVPLVIITGLLIAVLLNSTSHGRRLVQTLNFLPYITTPVAIGFIFAFLFDWNIGPVNAILRFFHIISANVNWLGSSTWAPAITVLLSVWRYFGYFMVLYLAGLAAVPQELYEAAVVDGASPVQNFFYITLPMVRPITVFVIINSMIGSFQLFDEPNLLFEGSMNGVVGGPGRSVLTIMWYFYDIAFRSTFRYGYGAALAFSLCLIIAFISILNVKILNRKEDT